MPQHAPQHPANPLDIEQPGALANYLRETSRIPQNATPSIQPLTGGVSNRAMLVNLPDGRAWAIKQALAKLRTNTDWFSDVARIEREATGMQYLNHLAPTGTITPLIFFDPANHILAMDAVPQPHENLKTMLLAGNLQTDHIEQLAQLIASIHTASARRRTQAAHLFDNREYFNQLRLEPYYSYAAQHIQDPPAAAFLNRLVATTTQRRLTIVHGDFSPKNVLVHNNQLVLLDHEVIHFGDPAFDLGFCLTHLLSKAHHLPEHRHAFHHAATRFWQTYDKAVRDEPFAFDLERHAVNHTIGCLLARVCGRSPLEYLTESQRTNQRLATLQLIHNPTTHIQQLADRFIQHINESTDRTAGANPS